MPEISVVIPVYKDDLELQGLLDALAFLAVKEIIIVDGEVRPQPEHIKCQSPKKIIQWRNAPQGRGSQIAEGIKAASQPIIWVLHADSRPEAKCPAEIITSLANPKTSLSCFPLSFRTSKLALLLFGLISQIDSPFTTFGDQGFAFRAADYDKLNIRLSEYPLLEDVVLRKALRSLGKVQKAQITIQASARRFEALGVWRTQIRNCGILINYWRGKSPAALKAQYYAATRQTALKSPLSWPARRVSMQVPAAAQKTASD